MKWVDGGQSRRAICDCFKNTRPFSTINNSFGAILVWHVVIELCHTFCMNRFRFEMFLIFLGKPLSKFFLWTIYNDSLRRGWVPEKDRWYCLERWPKNAVFMEQSCYLLCHLSPESIQNKECCLTTIAQFFSLLVKIRQNYFIDNFYRFFLIIEVHWINTQWDRFKKFKSGWTLGDFTTINKLQE